MDTIKDQLMMTMRDHANNRGIVNMSPEALGKRHGLNGHDLAKNLDQLKKEGLIHDPWVRSGKLGKLRLRMSGVNMQLLGGPQPQHEKRDYGVKSEALRNWMLRQATDEDGWVKVTPREISNAVGMDVGASVSADVKSGYMEAKRDGKFITALRIKGFRPSIRPVATTTPQPKVSARSIPETPELDAYRRAKRLAMLAPSVPNKYLKFEFTPDPIAEEALLLKAYIEAEHE